MNYLEDENQINYTFDTILCLSVTKWVHLNFGDDGIFKLFHIIYLQLNSKGHFILEYQPFRSYKKKYKFS
jgi:7SK snRNA methylphosphate capping enzyme